MNIDALEGHALNIAVAEALGWRKMLYVRVCDSWATDSNAAIDELDGEGWTWTHVEEGEMLDIWLHVPGHRSINVRVKLADFPTKSAAYATARCRAWLKAMAAKSNEEAAT